MVSFEFLEPTDPRWSEALTRIRHDVFHLPGYASLEATRLGGQARAAWVHGDFGELFLPLVVRHHPFGGLDAMSPYGYPGPIGGVGPSRLREAFDHLWAGIGEHGVESVFVRCHSWAGPDLSALRGQAGQWLVEHGDTVTIDLEQDEDAVFKAYRSTTRNLVRRLGRDGFQANQAPWSRAGEFLEIYTSTMRRLDASAGYFFDQAYLDGLKQELGDGLALFVVEREGQTAAAGLATCRDGSAQYYLSGARPEFARASPTRILVDAMWRWAKANGGLRMNLGGGLGGGEDSLFKFKAGFSKDRAQFQTLRVVTQPGRFRRSVAAWEARSGRGAPGPTDFFPPYRATVEQAA